MLQPYFAEAGGATLDADATVTVGAGVVVVPLPRWNSRSES